MKSGFHPAWWCRGPHAQTLWARLFRRAPLIPYRRERLELPDGDFIDLDWLPGGRGPIVILLHGLEGSSHSPYARGIMTAIERRGWRGVVMHFRGCSGVPNRLARGYHSGEIGDFSFLIRTLREREPDAVLAAVGISLGGNVLLKWLGTNAETNTLRAAVAVSVPMLLGITADRLSVGFSRLYQWYLMTSLRRSTIEKIKRIKMPVGAERVMACHTLREFDHFVTAPLHGFHGAEDYYSRSSSRQYLKDISIPTLIVQAEDDPFMTEGTIPESQELSQSVSLELSKRGGHVGFVSGRWPWRSRFWLDERIPDFLSPYLMGTTVYQETRSEK